MADEEPAVTLGDHQQVEGAPLARVSARLMWGIEKSAIVEREGDTAIRTPDGPRELAAVLDEVDQPYFATRREFEDAVRAVVGTGPIPTAGDAAEESDDSEAEDADGEDDETVEESDDSDTDTDDTAE